MKQVYPIYVPSKGRADSSLTVRCLMKHKVPFRVVIEEPEYDAYAAVSGEDSLLVLPFQNQGLIAARNWIKAHSIEEGHARHWQLDDNMRCFRRMWGRRRVPCSPKLALGVCEELTDRYTNVAVSGLNYTMFALKNGSVGAIPPFYKNVHVYSCSLINNAIPNRWRSFYNDDTDLCLQVLADGWCTLLLHAFTVDKMRTMTVKGGNFTDADGPANYKGDGRAKMSRALERLWPGVVTTKRRFKRPQHYIKNQWMSFDTPLIRRPDIDWDEIENREVPLALREVKPVQAASLRDWVKRGAPAE